MVLILHIIYNMLRQEDTQSARLSVFQRSTEIRIRLLRQVEWLHIVVDQLQDEGVAICVELDGDLVRIRGVVFDGVREELIDSQIERALRIIVDLLLYDEVVDKVKDLRERVKMSFELPLYGGHRLSSIRRGSGKYIDFVGLVQGRI